MPEFLKNLCENKKNKILDENLLKIRLLINDHYINVDVPSVTSIVTYIPKYRPLN